MSSILSLKILTLENNDSVSFLIMWGFLLFVAHLNLPPQLIWPIANQVLFFRSVVVCVNSQSGMRCRFNFSNAFVKIIKRVDFGH